MHNSDLRSLSMSSSDHRKPSYDYLQNLNVDEQDDAESDNDSLNTDGALEDDDNALEPSALS